MLIVLDEIAKRFSLNKKYSEQEVNDIILPFNEDYCRIRRELVDNGKMTRRNGIYNLTVPDSDPEIKTSEETESKKDVTMDRRKKLKKEFMEKFNPPGIFIIKNNINSKVFIGGSLNVNAFIKRHKAELKIGSHRNKKLQKDYKEFGDENFTFDVLESIEQNKDPLFDYNDDVAVLLELWSEKLKPFGDNGYNKKPKKKNK